MRFFIPIILLAVSFSAFVWFIDPAYQTIKELTRDAAVFDEALGNSKELQAIRDRVLSEFNAITPNDRDLLLKLLPNTVDNVRLVRDIDGIASRHNMTLRSVRVELGEDDRSVGPSVRIYGTATVSFAVSAQYRPFLSFLAELERSLRLVDIIHIAFVSSDQDVEFGTAVELSGGYLAGIPLASGSGGVLQLRAGGGLSWQMRRGEYVNPSKVDDDDDGILWLHRVGFEGKFGAQYNPVKAFGISVLGIAGLALAGDSDKWPRGDLLGSSDDAGPFERATYGAEAGITIADYVYLSVNMRKDKAISGNVVEEDGKTYENIGYDSIWLYGLNVGVSH